MCSPHVKLDHHFSTTENKNYPQNLWNHHYYRVPGMAPMPTQTNHHPTNQLSATNPRHCWHKAPEFRSTTLATLSCGSQNEALCKAQVTETFSAPSGGCFRPSKTTARSGWFLFEGRGWRKIGPRKLREICQFIVDFAFKTQKHPRNTHFRKETSTQNIRWTLLSFLEQKN